MWNKMVDLFRSYLNRICILAMPASLYLNRLFPWGKVSTLLYPSYLALTKPIHNSVTLHEIHLSLLAKDVQKISWTSPIDAYFQDYGWVTFGNQLVRFDGRECIYGPVEYFEFWRTVHPLKVYFTTENRKTKCNFIVIPTISCSLNSRSFSWGSVGIRNPFIDSCVFLQTPSSVELILQERASTPLETVFRTVSTFSLKKRSLQWAKIEDDPLCQIISRVPHFVELSLRT